MAATETVTRISLIAKLDNGTTSTGEVKTISQSMGDINKDRWDADKAYAIGAALSPCLTKSIYALEYTKNIRITNAA